MRIQGHSFQNIISHNFKVCKFIRPMSEGRTGKTWNVSNNAILSPFPPPPRPQIKCLWLLPSFSFWLILSCFLRRCLILSVYLFKPNSNPGFFLFFLLRMLHYPSYVHFMTIRTNVSPAMHSVFIHQTIYFLVAVLPSFYCYIYLQI
jgi:hypothetical protein